MPYDIVFPALLRTAGASQVSSTLTVPQDANLRAEILVTASTAPTTLDCKIEHSPDGGTTWFSLGAFTQVGAVSSASQSIAIPAPNHGIIRANYTLVGTNYTFSVTVRSVSLTN